MQSNEKTRDLRTGELMDIRDVYICRDLPREQRIAEYIHQIKDPYHFKCGEITVHVSFNLQGPTLEECIAGMMR